MDLNKAGAALLPPPSKLKSGPPKPLSSLVTGVGSRLLENSMFLFDINNTCARNTDLIFRTRGEE